MKRLNRLNKKLKFRLLHIAFAIICATPLVSFGQQQLLPLNREFNLANEKALNSQQSNTHNSFKPIIQSAISFTDSGINHQDDYMINLKKNPESDRSWIIRKVFFENFVVVDEGNFYMTIDPLFNGEIGKDSEDAAGTTFYKNTRGAIVRANVGEKFSFETSLYENQMRLPGYLSSYVRGTGVVPGQGRVKAFKQDGIDFASSSATLTYTPYKFLNLQLGTGKNFVGDGYRSLLLSDYSFNYPFIKLITTFGKQKQFQYTKLNASLSSITRRDVISTPEALFVRKSMSTHYFSWLPTKWLNVGFFESTMWHTEDTSGTKPYQFQQLNPIIGLNTLTTVSDSLNHSNVGLNLKFKLPHDIVLYGQFVMDGNQYEKTTGYQAGLRFSGVKGLTLQAEYNVMDNPYTSTFYSDLEQFTNYNESLAHPQGDNFTELVGIINYKYKRAFIQLKHIVIDNDRFGYSSNQSDGHIGYVVNPKNNMTLITGLKIRDDVTSKTNFVYFGFRTNLRNLYNDF
jgi:hypothetical protein